MESDAKSGKSSLFKSKVVKSQFSVQRLQPDGGGRPEAEGREGDCQTGGACGAEGECRVGDFRQN